MSVRWKFGNGFARADVTDVTDVSPMSVGRRKKEEAVSCVASRLPMVLERERG
ncbi:hypothetical protein Q5692_19205 [Microcoleus sp. C2C3]|uniref:hypothetical protein n=1 Tax=unclassified Microcoleus TaxID=2642155 RepID=UPI002FD382BD